MTMHDKPIKDEFMNVEKFLDEGYRSLSNSPIDPNNTTTSASQFMGYASFSTSSSFPAYIDEDLSSQVEMLLSGTKWESKSQQKPPPINTTRTRSFSTSSMTDNCNDQYTLSAPLLQSGVNFNPSPLFNNNTNPLSSPGFSTPLSLPQIGRANTFDNGSFFQNRQSFKPYNRPHSSSFSSSTNTHTQSPFLQQQQLQRTHQHQQYQMKQHQIHVKQQQLELQMQHQRAHQQNTFQQQGKLNNLSIQIPSASSSTSATNESPRLSNSDLQMLTSPSAVTSPLSPNSPNAFISYASPMMKSSSLRTQVYPDNQFLPGMEIFGPSSSPSSSSSQQHPPHPDPNTHVRYRCACGKLFQKLCGLKSHVKVHQSQGATLRVNAKGVLEWLTESGIPVIAPPEEVERSFYCGECGRNFLRKQDLRRHAGTHGGEGKKKFQCEHCGTSFSRSDALYRHNKASRCRKD